MKQMTTPIESEDYSVFRVLSTALLHNIHSCIPIAPFPIANIGLQMELARSDRDKNSSLRLRISPHLRVRDNAEAWTASSGPLTLFNVAAAIETELNASSTRDSLIGIALEKSAVFVAAAIGVIQSRGANAFMALDVTVEYALKQCSRFKISRIVGRRAWLANMLEAAGKDGHFAFDEVYSGIDPIYLTSALSTGATMKWSNEEGKPLRILYAIQTSGSTGEPKTVHVPESSIMPNIVDFIERFSLDVKSRILFSTSLSFDPSMVEMLVAIHAGCELIVADNTDFHTLETTIATWRPNFIQLTPATLQYFSTRFLTTLFGADSPSRFVLIGGEKFPLNLVRSKWNPRCPTRIFNVYGVTEVSCWASCYELTRADMEDGSPSAVCSNKVPIGEPITLTQLTIDQESGLVVIRGRGCVVNFSNAHGDVSWTADRGMRVEPRKAEEKPGICVQGRAKPNSTLPSKEIEALVTEAHHEVALCRCVYVGDCRFLFAWHCDGTSTIPCERLRKTLPRRLWPTRVFWNVDDKCLLNTSGKIDEKALHSHVLNASHRQAEGGGISKFLRSAYALDVDDEETAGCTLRSLGLGSLELAEIALFLKSVFHHPSDAPINHLLAHNLTLRGLIHAIETGSSTPGTSQLPTEDVVSMDPSRSPLAIRPDERFHARLKWESDLAKCIDASPALRDGKHPKFSLVYIGSHAGILRCLDAENGSVIGEFTAPGRRFERSCTVTEDYVVIGSYTRLDAEDQGSVGGVRSWRNDPTADGSGELFIFTPKLEKLLERMATADEIQMAPTVEGPNIYWATHGAVFYAKDMQTGLLTSHRVARKSKAGVHASPLVVGQLVVLATLGAELVAWHRHEKKIAWCQELNGPVFADLVPLPGVPDSFCVVTALGSMSIHRVGDGAKICELDTRDAIFGAPTLIGADGAQEVVPRTLMLAGSSDGHILLLAFNGASIELLRRCIIPDGKFAVSPLLLGCKDVFAMTTKGLLLHLNLDELRETKRRVEADIVLSVGAETFGSPVVTAIRQRDGGEEACYRLIVGSRDNKLRCFEISHERTL